MSRATQTALIQDDRTVYEAAAGTAVGLSGVTFAVGLAALLALWRSTPPLLVSSCRWCSVHCYSPSGRR